MIDAKVRARYLYIGWEDNETASPKGLD
jgi:hypothetical protein